MEKIIRICTPEAPAPIGPYTQAAGYGSCLFTSGQLGLDPVTGQMAAGGITSETHQALENIRAILKAAGTGMDAVIKTTVYMADLDEFGPMNDVYSGFFPASPPARSCVQVARLPRGARVEIEAVAVI